MWEVIHACSTEDNASLSALAWEEREMERKEEKNKEIESSLCAQGEFVDLRERKAVDVPPQPDRTGLWCGENKPTLKETGPQKFEL